MTGYIEDSILMAVIGQQMEDLKNLILESGFMRRI
jgi:hypothetical protein